MDCIFCKIASGEIPSDILYQEDGVIAFNDMNPKAPVHVLIIPKEHIESIKELEEQNKGVVDDLVYAAKKIAEDKELEGYKLSFNVGKEGGQEVGHLHLHLLGGWKK